MKPLIGISPNIIRHESWAPLQYGQNDTYTDVILLSGGLPVILPLADDTEALRELYDKLDGLLLAGGEDIKQPGNLRDRTELLLAKWALTDGKPILGTCRGMQLLNHALGGTLCQDIARAHPEALDHNASHEAKDLAHVARTVNIEPTSRLHEILAVPSIGINEYHHQAIERLGKGLKAVVWTSDGIIEAIESTDSHFVFGVQCHPESLVVKDTEPAWKSLFSAFITSAINHSKEEQHDLFNRRPKQRR